MSEYKIRFSRNVSSFKITRSVKVSARAPTPTVFCNTYGFTWPRRAQNLGFVIRDKRVK